MHRIFLDASPIDIATAEEAAEWTLERMERGERTSVAGVNASIAVLAQEEPDVSRMLKEFDLVLADGLWLAWAASVLNGRKVPHANTSPFVKEVFKKSGSGTLKVFLLGAQQEVVTRASERMTEFHPQAEVVGFENGYFKEEDEAGVVERINASGAEVVLVGMSTPMKEQFIRRHWADLNVGISIGVGGLFDVWAGKTHEVSDLLRRLGLEWVFRLFQEPRRLFLRYTVANSRFIWLVVKLLFRKD